MPSLSKHLAVINAELKLIARTPLKPKFTWGANESKSLDDLWYRYWHCIWGSDCKWECVVFSISSFFVAHNQRIAETLSHFLQAIWLKNLNNLEFGFALSCTWCWHHKVQLWRRNAATRLENFRYCAIIYKQVVHLCVSRLFRLYIISIINRYTWNTIWHGSNESMFFISW